MKQGYFQILLFALSLGFSGLLPAQGVDSLRLKQSILVTASFVTNDHLSNTYIVSSENAVAKYDSLGRQVASYTNKRLGLATFLDASNPLKILLWYPDFQTVIILDRTLSELGRLDFSRAGFYSVRCVAMAFDGNIWVFDDAISKAVKLSFDGAVLLESPPLNRYFQQRFSATRMQDSGRLLYLNDPLSGLCTLDQYANIEAVLNTMRMSDFDSEGDWLFFLEADRLCLQNQMQLLQLFIPLPQIEPKGKVWLGNGGVFLQHAGVLERYSWD